MDSSKYNLWRACFAFCHLDKKLTEAEQAWMIEKLEKLSFTAEQKKTLLDDFRDTPDILNLLPLITKPSDRGFLVDQMRWLSKMDGVLTTQEKSKIEEVRSLVLSKINLPELNKIIERDEKASYHEDEVYKAANEDSMFEAVFSRFQKLINPGDYKLPDEE